MAHKRTEFSDRQKAEIFARDRATCCFSGANLWLLDTPLFPGYQMDWVDHVKPSAKAGSAELSNGVCASHTFNAKKRDNTADTNYLFFEGKPTEIYLSIFGVLDKDSVRRLKRLERLQSIDWYFNRAVANILIAFDWRCQKQRYRIVHKRDDRYWFKAGFGKLAKFLKNEDVSSFEKRRLLTRSSEMSWLDLGEASTCERMLEVIEEIFPEYQKNYNAWAAYFWDAECENDLLDAFEDAKKHDANPTIIACMEQDLGFRLKEI